MKADQGGEAATSHSMKQDDGRDGFGGGGGSDDDVARRRIIHRKEIG